MISLFRCTARLFHSIHSFFAHSLVRSLARFLSFVHSVWFSVFLFRSLSLLAPLHMFALVRFVSYSDQSLSCSVSFVRLLVRPLFRPFVQSPDECSPTRSTVLTDFLPPSFFRIHSPLRSAAFPFLHSVSRSVTPLRRIAFRVLCFPAQSFCYPLLLVLRCASPHRFAPRSQTFSIHTTLLATCPHRVSLHFSFPFLSFQTAFRTRCIPPLRPSIDTTAV